MKEGYMTTGEALFFLGMHQHTFDRYVMKFGIKKEHKGRNTFYRKEDVEYLNNVLGNRVPTLIKMLEKITGGKVTITMPE